MLVLNINSVNIAQKHYILKYSPLRIILTWALLKCYLYKVNLTCLVRYKPCTQTHAYSDAWFSYC